jgi:hypothetical protein
MEMPSRPNISQYILCIMQIKILDFECYRLEILKYNWWVCVGDGNGFLSCEFFGVDRSF